MCIIKITFKNVIINGDIDSKIAFDLKSVKHYLDTGIIGIYSADYSTTDDNRYNFKVELVGIPDICFNYSNLGYRKINYQGEIFYGEEYYEEEYPIMSFISDEVIVEKIPIDINIMEKYNRNSEFYKNNHIKLSTFLEKDIIKFINGFYLFSYAHYDDGNLLLYFKDDLPNYNKCIYLKLINAKIQLLDNDMNNEFVLVNKMHHIINSLNMRFSRTDDGFYEIGFLISEIREIIIKCSDIQIGEYDNISLVNKVKTDYINRINYHDGDIKNYKRNGNNISFELKDGWEYDLYYEFQLKNVKVQLMNNQSDLICYILDVFNNINKYGKINLYSGECGILEEPIGKCKYYLKLWIRHPYDLNIKTEITMEEYKFDGIDVVMSDDYDDTGRLYIKFLVEDIVVEKL